MGLRPEISQNNALTTISYYLSEPGPVMLRVFSADGKLVRILENSRYAEAGYHDAIWNERDGSGQDVASGVYFYQFRTSSFSETKKMVKLR